MFEGERSLLKKGIPVTDSAFYQETVASHSNGQRESPSQCAQTCTWQECLLTYRNKST